MLLFLCYDLSMEKQEQELFKEIRYQPLQNVKKEGQIDRIILFKPVLAPFVILIVGIGLIALSFKVENKITLIILGSFFILMALVVIFFVKDKKVCDIYSKGVLLYNPNDSNYAWFLKYDDVKEWEVSHPEGHDFVVFTLKDLNKIGFDTFQANKAYKTLYKYIPEKEAKTIKAEKARKKPLQFNNWLKDRINSFKK